MHKLCVCRGRFRRVFLCAVCFCRVRGLCDRWALRWHVLSSTGFLLGGGVVRDSILFRSRDTGALLSVFLYALAAVRFAPARRAPLPTPAW